MTIQPSNMLGTGGPVPFLWIDSLKIMPGNSILSASLHGRPLATPWNKMQKVGAVSEAQWSWWLVVRLRCASSWVEDLSICPSVHLSIYSILILILFFSIILILILFLFYSYSYSILFLFLFYSILILFLFLFYSYSYSILFYS